MLPLPSLSYLTVYRKRDSPRFLLGHAVVLGYIAMGIVCALLLMTLLKRENNARDRGEVRRSLPLIRRPPTRADPLALLSAHPQRDELIDPNGSEHGSEPFKNTDGTTTYTSVEQARSVLGDKHSSYRYLI